VDAPEEEPETPEDLEETAHQDQGERGRQPGWDDLHEGGRSGDVKHSDRDHGKPQDHAKQAFELRLVGHIRRGLAKGAIRS
jgi:hypothetical protein